MSTPSNLIAPFAFSAILTGCLPAAVYPGAPDQEIALVGELGVVSSYQNPGADQVSIEVNCTNLIPTRDLSSMRPEITFARITHGSSNPLRVEFFDPKKKKSGPFEIPSGKELYVSIKPGDFSGLKPGNHEIALHVFDHDGTGFWKSFNVSFADRDDFVSNLAECSPVVVSLH